MRSLGKIDLARRAERFAARVRFDLDEPEAARGLYTLARNLREARETGSLLERALDAALAASGAERGNIQMLNPATRSLRIVTHYGFSAEFLEYFAVADDRGSACGRSARERAQIVIADVSLDPGFAPHRDIAAASGFRAVQSTPLVDLSGRMVGVVSTHYAQPFRPSDRDLLILNRIGELVGEAVSSHPAASATPGDGNPSLAAASRDGRVL
jgi:GAF domain-containing protein